MISGNMENILSPIRTINGKVEVIDTSASSQSGTAVRIEGCDVGAPLIIDVGAAGVEVSRYGKNLLDTTTYELTANYILAGGGHTGSTGYKAIIDFIPCSHLQGQTITLNHSVAEKSTTGNPRTFVFYTGASASSVISGANTRDGTYTVPATATHMRITVPNNYNIEDLQIELGDKATTLEDYKEPMVVISNESGLVEGITALPVNTITTNQGVIITASYLVDVPGDTYSNRDKLKSIQIDRVGENKFFGFGISQKATVAIVDKDCECGLAKGDRLTACFDDITISPTFYITEVKRDEITNELTITAYDALEKAATHTVSELGLESYTIGGLASACAGVLNTVAVYPPLEIFNLNYEAGANFEGTETIREALNAIAEATQTIYYLNRNNELVFVRLDKEGAAVLNINKSQYISLNNKMNVVLTDICSITELGDNLEAGTGARGEAQNVYDNPLWELREDLPQLLEEAVGAVGGTNIYQYNLEWRGNYLLEPCDKISITTKMDDIINSYLLNDTITYDGGYRQVSKWEYEPQEKGSTNPTTIGEAIKQTYAKVDKVNKTVEIVASETTGNTENIAQLQMDTGSISASVSNVEQALADATNTINGELTTISEKVNATMTSEEILFEISTAVENGVDSVQTGKGFTFNDEGLTIEDLENPDIITQITNNGMGVYKGSIDDANRVLTANDRGVNAKDLHANTYLIIGDYSRFENYGDQARTACFWIG